MGKYDDAQRDPELLSARSDVALLEARLLELTERLSSGESGQLWDDLRNVVSRIDTAEAGDHPRILATIKTLVERGSADEAVWRQMHEMIEKKTKVASQEWKRLVDMEQVITAEKAVAFAMQLLEIVLRHVPEPDRRKKIAGEVHALMNLEGAGPPRRRES